jgi:hypothetical protein
MRLSAIFALLAALALGGTEARAAGDPVAQARVYYDAGTQAYAAGRYVAAVEAFTEAYRLLDKPPILFSLAQAERRQYTVSLDPRTLQSSIAHFRKYIAEVLQDGRRADAVSALAELEALTSRVDAAGPSAAAPPPAALATRVMISTATKGAVVVLDDKEYTDVPVIEPVKPGKHTVRVSAPGYVDETRELVAVDGALSPMEIVLTEKPSFLALGAPLGALVTVDGRAYGDAPLEALELKPGSRLVMVTQTGHTPYLARVAIERGQITTLHVTLPRTRQRVASFALGGTGVVAGVVGGALALAAFGQEHTLRDIQATAIQRNLTSAEAATFNSALDTRDGLRRDALVIAGVGGALALTAAALYFLDNPTPPTGDGPRSSRAHALSLTLGPAGVIGRF